MTRRMLNAWFVCLLVSDGGMFISDLSLSQSDQELHNTGKQGRTKKSDAARLDVRCVDKTCAWRLFWSRSKKVAQWTLSKLVLEHSCTGAEMRQRSVRTDRVIALAGSVIDLFVPVGENETGRQGHRDTHQLMTKKDTGVTIKYGMAKKIVTVKAGSPFASMMK
jgi:hypothetical protein